jgi:ribosomal protein S18 acetylase RimI-like enzyme
MADGDVKIRMMTAADAEAVARMHAASWKVAYRGILTDDYLDNHADDDRQATWHKRLATHDESSFGIVAEERDAPIGFAFVVVNEDAKFGNLLDNLHVIPSFKGRGVGRLLMSAVANELRERHAMQSLHLWVYEDNVAARGFYDRLQGVPAERKSVVTLDNQSKWQWRYFWPDVSVLS